MSVFRSTLLERINLRIKVRLIKCQALIWDLIVLVPDHCLSFYFDDAQITHGNQDIYKMHTFQIQYLFYTTNTYLVKRVVDKVR